MVPRTPSAGKNGDRRPSGATGTATEETAIRDYVCAVVGSVAVVVGVVTLHPSIIAADHPFATLAITALVCLFVVAWLAVSTCLEAVWTRHIGRLDSP